MEKSVIEIRGLKKNYGVFNLGPFDLSVPSGAIFGLIGPNAAGKTTTLDMVMGMGAPDAGTIEIFGMDNRANEVAIKSRVGYVSPDLGMESWKYVRRLIYFVSGFYPDWDSDYCMKLLDKFGIGWDDKIAALSYGTKMKLALTLALSHRPELLILDEPTLGLDAVAKKQIFTELLEAVQDEKRTVVIASNTLTDIERFADHFGMIKNGRLLVEGPTADIIERYRMIDFLNPDGILPPNAKSIRIQSRANGRWRALVDMQSDAPAWIKEKGFQQISSTPVTLEELFVALVGEE